MTGFRAAHKAPAQQGCLPGFEALSADAAQFRATRYETIAPLLARLTLSGGHWVEPCAGDGDIVRHVARAAQAGLCKRPMFWTCVELRRSLELEAMALTPDLYTQLCGRIWSFDEQDFLAFADYDPGVSTVITNLPWYGVSDLLEHAFALYPRADIVALCCVRELLDGGRPAWFGRHVPDLYWCHGRQRFTDYSNRSAREGAYPHPVAWMHWPAGEPRTRTSGRWEVLPPYSEVAT